MGSGKKHKGEKEKRHKEKEHKHKSNKEKRKKRKHDSSTSNSSDGEDDRPVTVQQQLHMGRAAARAVREILAYKYDLRKDVREVRALGFVLLSEYSTPELILLILFDISHCQTT